LHIHCCCRARRKIEEARAKERYEQYVQQKAQEEVARREAEAAAAIKAQQQAERQQLAAEAYKKRQVGAEARADFCELTGFAAAVFGMGWSRALLTGEEAVLHASVPASQWSSRGWQMFNAVT
jgi:hypothetical protein